MFPGTSGVILLDQLAFWYVVSLEADGPASGRTLTSEEMER